MTASQAPFRTLYRSEIVHIGDYRCQTREPARGPQECNTVPSVAFVRRGSFVKHLGPYRIVADAGMAVFFNPAEPYRVSHPAGCGDRCSVFHLADGPLREILRASDPAGADRESRVFSRPQAAVAPGPFLAHRLLLGALAAGSCDPLAVDEAAVEVMAAALGGGHEAVATRRGRAETRRAHRDLAADARIVLNRRSSERMSLGALAREVHSSPYHLSRVFRAQVGSTIRRYRNRLRVRAALDAIACGEKDLTRLALSLGYGDQSHFTNAFRDEFGTTPSAVRRGATAADLRRMSKFFQV